MRVWKTFTSDSIADNDLKVGISDRFANGNDWVFFQISGSRLYATYTHDEARQIINEILTTLNEMDDDKSD